ncbi:hypothetical protein ACJJTC_012688 [Scirpophaga incertulas]
MYVCTVLDQRYIAMHRCYKSPQHRDSLIWGRDRDQIELDYVTCAKRHNAVFSWLLRGTRGVFAASSPSSPATQGCGPVIRRSHQRGGGVIFGSGLTDRRCGRGFRRQECPSDCAGFPVSSLFLIDGTVHVIGRVVAPAVCAGGGLRAWTRTDPGSMRASASHTGLCTFLVLERYI